MKNKNLYFIYILILVNSLVSAQWQKVFNPGSRILTIKHIDNRIYVGTEDNGTWLSKDNGDTWTKLNTNSLIGSYDVRDIESDGYAVWIGTRGGGVIYSANGEDNWELVNDGFDTQAYISSLVLVGDTLFAAHSTDAGLMPSGIYKTSIEEINWKRSGYGFPVNIYSISSMEFSFNNLLYVGNQHSATKGNLYLSNDTGKTWISRNVDSMIDINCLINDYNYTYAGTNNGLYYTTDLDSVWHIYGTELKNYYVDDICKDNERIYSAVDQVGIIYSNDNGISWANISYNLPLENEYISNLEIINDFLYVGLGSKNGLWKLPLNITGINDDEIMERFNLYQNYPNPFNPSTSINYVVNENVFVNIVVYDALGRKIKELVNEEKYKGNYLVHFDGSKYSNGIYYCRMQAGDFTKTNKMILLK